jgi:hypothetical protein
VALTQVFSLPTMDTAASPINSQPALPASSAATLSLPQEAGHTSLHAPQPARLQSKGPSSLTDAGKKPGHSQLTPLLDQVLRLQLQLEHREQSVRVATASQELVALLQV